MKVFCILQFLVIIYPEDQKQIRYDNNQGRHNVLVELSPAAYLALCGLVRDALEVENSDARPVLERVAEELMGVTAGGMISSELAENPAHMEALRRGGFLARG